MDILILEELLNEEMDDRHVSILQLIIDAVRDYPLELTDTELYFNIIKQKLGSNDITADLLKAYLNLNPEEHNENNIWAVSSISALFEAFQLMKIYNIAFDDIVNTIESLNSK